MRQFPGISSPRGLLGEPIMSQRPENRDDSPRTTVPRFRRLWLLGATLLLAPPVRSAQIQDLDEIRAAVESFVAAQTLDIDASRSIEVGNLDARVRLARCEEGLRIFFAPGSHNGSRRTVGVSCPGTKPWTIYVSARITRRGPVLVATRNLPRGAVIEASDLATEERNIEESPSGYLTNPTEALGKRASRPLRLGLPVTTGGLEDVPVIDRGQRVWLLAESRSLTVRMSGTALEPGAPGDRIRVQNNESKKVVEGLVGDDGFIRIGI
jgi:flagella basal body P-ring formation protein FlgA